MSVTGTKPRAASSWAGGDGDSCVLYGMVSVVWRGRVVDAYGENSCWGVGGGLGLVFLLKVIVCFYYSSYIHAYKFLEKVVEQ